MGSRVRILGCAFALLGCSSCLIGFVRTIDYDYTLSTTRLTSGVESRPETPSGAHAGDLLTGDQVATFSFDVGRGNIKLAIHNNGTVPMRLAFDEGHYVDVEGKEHPLYAAGPKNRGEAPERVEPGSEVKVFLWARDWMGEYPPGHPSTTRADSPFDGELLIAEESRAEAMELGRRNVGRTFVILLPVDVGPTRHFYRFAFTACGMHVRRILWA